MHGFFNLPTTHTPRLCIRYFYPPQIGSEKSSTPLAKSESRGCRLYPLPGGVKAWRGTGAERLKEPYGLFFGMPSLRWPRVLYILYDVLHCCVLIVFVVCLLSQCPLSLYVPRAKKKEKACVWCMFANNVGVFPWS